MLGNVISEMGAREASLCPSARSEEEDDDDDEGLEAEKASSKLEWARLGKKETLICGRAGEASRTES